ncbi:MAG TPA: hypothetical protein VM076_12965 [Gemmatimonadaceae bacterium]|nr:hypothetical protein [Gemmatimonadaceae bacterium]
MTPANSDRARALSRLGIALAIVAAISLPTHDASAQLGGLVKKARDKVVENQVEKQIDKRTGTSSSPGAAPKFDDVTLELTTERVAQMVRGLSAGRAALDGRAAIVARRDAAAQKSADLHDKNNKLISDYTDKRYANERCRNDAMNTSREKRRVVAEKEAKELQAKAMSDPAFREKAVAIGMKMAEAQARGDTAAFMKLAAEMGLKADDPKPDSLAADKACGRELPRPVVLAQIDSLDGVANRLSEEIRKMEEKAAATEIKESGLTERQFLMARERIEAYLSNVKYKPQPAGFSPAEQAALGSARGDLEKVM